MSSVQHQIADFISGTQSEYAFPAELSVEERKLVKTTAEKLGLSSRSFGMGSERQIHIFKPVSSTSAIQPVEYSVKNTFIDGPVVDQEARAPAHQSMPAGALECHIAAEEESLAAIALAKGRDSPRNSEVDTTSTKDSDSEPHDAPISIKNTFVHFEGDAKEHLDPRIIQSMPAGTFADNLQADREAAANAGNQRRRPVPLSEDSEAETEGSSKMLFPSTPNGDNQMNFGTGPVDIAPTVQWMPPASVPPESSVTVLPSAVWAPAPQVPAPSMPPQAPQEQAPAVPFMQGPPQEPPQVPASLISPQESGYFAPGTSVVLQGLASQPEFNGLRGTVSAFDAACGRYNVMVEFGPNAVKRLVKIKFQNLVPEQPMAVPQPPCYMPAQQPVAMGRPVKASLVLDQMV
jgi:hypothetical protein